MHLSPPVPIPFYLENLGEKTAVFLAFGDILEAEYQRRFECDTFGVEQDAGTSS